MNEQGSGVEFRATADQSRAIVALFVVGLAVVAGNSVLYFFGVELAHPAASVLGLGLLAPLYRSER